MTTNIASKAQLTQAQNLVLLGVLAAVGLTALAVFLVVQSRRQKSRLARTHGLVRQLDGRPLVYVRYADCLLPVTEVLSTAQAHGYAMTPNPAALRYEFARGAPQTAFTGNPRAAYVAQMLDGRPVYHLRILFEPMSLVELMVLAHSRGYTVQPVRKYYEFRFAGGRA